MQPQLLTPDVLAMEQVIATALSDNNELRRQAEANLIQQKVQHPNLYFVSLIVLLCAEDRPQHVREFCAVMIRQALAIKLDLLRRTEKKSSHAPFVTAPGSTSLSFDLYSQLTSDSLTLTRQLLIERLVAEGNGHLRRMLVDCIGSLAARIFSLADEDLVEEEKGELNEQLKKQLHAARQVKTAQLAAAAWPQLMQTFQQLMTSNVEFHRESSLHLLDKLAEYVDIAVLTPYLSQCHTLLIASLQPTSPAPIRLAALRALISLLLCLTDQEQLQLQPTIPLMFSTIHTAATTNDDDTLLASIQALMTLISQSASFLRPHVKSIITLMTQLATSAHVEEEIKRASIELLVTLVESGAGMVRKITDVAAAVVPIAYSMLLEWDHSPAEWDSCVKDSEDDDEYGNFKFGKEIWMTLASSLGVKLFVPVAFPLIRDSLSRTDSYIHRHAALIALSKTSEGLGNSLESLVPTLLTLILPYLHNKNEHVRVRWAAADCLERFSVEYAPSFQEKYHSIVVPALLCCLSMEHNTHPRLIKIAAGGLINFFESMSGDEEDEDDQEKKRSTINEYAQSILTACIQLLSTNHPLVQESVVALISALALVLKSDFVKFYPHFYPGVKSIVIGATDPNLVHLRGEAITAIGCMAEAVGAEVFEVEFAGAMECFLSLLNQHDSKLNEQLFIAIPRMAKCMKQRFAPYLRLLVPTLLQAASVNNAILLVDEGTEESIKMSSLPGYETVNVQLSHLLGKQTVAVNADLALQKDLAFEAVLRLADNCEADYFPFVEATAKIVADNLAYSFGERVRLFCVSICAPLVRSTVQALQASPSQMQAAVSQLVALLHPHFLESIECEIHTEEATGSLAAYQEMIEALPESILLTSEQVEEIIKVLGNLCKESFDDIKRREERKKDEDYDEEEEEQIAEENKDDSDLLNQIYTTFATLLTHNKATILPSFQQHLHPLLLTAIKSPHPSILTFCICVLSQLITDISPPIPLTLSYCDLIFPICLAKANKKEQNNELRHSSCFAIGAIATVQGPAFKPVLRASLDALIKVIEAKDSREGDNAPATDSAISSVGKIIRSCSSVFSNSGQERLSYLLPLWFSYLPCEADELEAASAHDQLLDYVENGEKLILGDKGEHWPRVFSVLGSVVNGICVSDKGKERIVRLLMQLKEKLGEAWMSKIMKKVGNKNGENEAIQSILQGLESTM